MEKYTSPLEEVRKKRMKVTNEIFTPPELTNEILDKLPKDVWEPEKTFCDPACGNGNIVLEVIKRKIEHKHTPFQALSTTFGVDLMQDNIDELKERVLELFDEDLHEELKPILKNNFICHNSLEWDFENWRSSTPKINPLF